MSAYCMRCFREGLAWGTLCDRSERIDNGANVEVGLARYEGTCLRCCSHNHG